MDDTQRPPIENIKSGAELGEYYWLKEELAAFLREHGLPSSGSKAELAQRAARLLDGQDICAVRSTARKRGDAPDVITDDTVIEKDIVCSEKHRAYFREKIGSGFSFNVGFQRWLRANAGKKYIDAVAAYHEILAEKKRAKSTVGSQFEYNAYIRDFFADNKGAKLEDAIKCWKYKKSLRGHNKYERSDLAALENAE